MKRQLWIVVFLAGCGGGRSPAVYIVLSDGGTGDPSECVNTIELVPLETRRHIPVDTVPIYAASIPTSGEHYGDHLARWRFHRQIVPRGYWVHNLEHGGVVFLYRDGASSGIVDALARVYERIPVDPPCSHGRVLVVEDSELTTEWAVTVSGPENPSPPPLGNGYVIRADCIKSEQALVDFAIEHRNKSAETLCTDGDYP
jgi:hypothetical protein